MKRRTFLAGAACSVLATPSIAATGTSRTFEIYRDGSLIGTHVLDAVQSNGGFEIQIDIEIAIKILGITAYRYTLNNREVWSGGVIQSVASKVDDDGDADFANVSAAGGALAVKGSRFDGEVGPDAVTTSYFATPFLNRGPWISTQSGTPLKVKVSPIAGRKRWHAVKGDLETTLGYDERGEWVGCEFDAGGELASYKLIGETGAIAALWANA